MAELHVGILLGQLHDEGAVIAEGGREDEVRAVEVDHRFHRLGDRVRLGDVLLLDDGDARHLLEDFHGHGVGLVPAEVIARADIDGAQHDRGLRPGEAHGQRRGRQTGCAGLEQ